MYRNDDRIRPNYGILWGNRKMIPHPERKDENNLDWFVNNGCEFIPQFFYLMKKNLTESLTNEDTDGDICDRRRFLNVICGVDGWKCDDYVFSGECIIANFGFVREQDMHMDYLPVIYGDDV